MIVFPVRRSQHQREQGRRKRVENGASSRSVADGLHPHQPHQTCQLVGSGPDTGFSMVVHSPYHQICRQVVTDQSIMGRRDKKSAAQQIELLVLAIVLAQHPPGRTLTAYLGFGVLRRPSSGLLRAGRPCSWLSIRRIQKGTAFKAAGTLPECPWSRGWQMTSPRRTGNSVRRSVP